MRLLLCLPTAQHIPSLLSVHRFRPDRLVLLASPGGRRALAPQRLLDALHEGGLDYAARHEIAIIHDEYSLTAVEKALQEVYARHADDQWVINLTGGTKPTAIAAYEFFRPRRATLVYANAAIPESVRFLYDGRLEPWGYRPSLREFLAGYGFRVLNPDEASRRAEDQAQGFWECSRRLAGVAASESLLLLGATEREQARKGKLTLRPEQCGRILKEPGVRDLVAQVFQLETKADALQGPLSKDAGKFLTGEWLEVFFWNLLHRHRDTLAVWDVRLGLNVETADHVQNELDVTFLHRYTLNMIECKTGEQEDNPAAGVLYKMEAVMQQFRATRIRSFLARTSDNVLEKKTLTVRPFLRTRAQLYNCTVLSSVQIRELAERQESAETVARVLGL